MEEHSDQVNHQPEQISQLEPADALPRYECDVHQVADLFFKNGFQIAERTITSYCRSNLLDCEKFVNGNVTKWKVTRDSVDKRIKTLQREGGVQAGSNQQKPVGNLASDSELQPDAAGQSRNELVEILKGELKEKNDQIREYQSIIHSHNALFDNLNKTIQLSNQSLQQLNGIIALPQVSDIVQKQSTTVKRDYAYEIPIRKIDEDSDRAENADSSQEDNSSD